MSDTDFTLQDRIDALFQKAEQADEVTREFAHDSLNHFRRECQAALAWQRSEGRLRIAAGEQPEHIYQLAASRVSEARRKLYDRLVSLMNWSQQHTGETSPSKKEPAS